MLSPREWHSWRRKKMGCACSLARFMTSADVRIDSFLSLVEEKRREQPFLIAPTCVIAALIP